MTQNISLSLAEWPQEEDTWVGFTSLLQIRPPFDKYRNFMSFVISIFKILKNCVTLIVKTTIWLSPPPHSQKTLVTVFYVKVWNTGLWSLWPILYLLQSFGGLATVWWYSADSRWGRIGRRPVGGVQFPFWPFSKIDTMKEEATEMWIKKNQGQKIGCWGITMQFIEWNISDDTLRRQKWRKIRKDE